MPCPDCERAERAVAELRSEFEQRERNMLDALHDMADLVKAHNRTYLADMETRLHALAVEINASVQRTLNRIDEVARSMQRGEPPPLRH
jgi:hypothetical protein